MTVPASAGGRVAVVGAGMAGLAAALSVHDAGHRVVLLERHPAPKPAGNVLNLWPPPIRALQMLGVDMTDLGATCTSEFRSLTGRRRARVTMPDEVSREFGGGFMGVLRPDLFERVLAHVPPDVPRFGRALERFEQDENSVRLHLDGGETLEVDVLIGADGIDSVVRRQLWGDVPKRPHNTYVISGYTFDPSVQAPRGLVVVGHSRRHQASWTSLYSKGREGNGWWLVIPHPDGTAVPDDLITTAKDIVRHDAFPSPMADLIDATEPEHVLSWVLRDRPRLKQWSKGRVTVIGDAAHPTSPYAAYGAGMATEDGYLLGRRLAGVDLTDLSAASRTLQEFEDPRKPHTARQVEQAWILGRVFHHSPAPLQVLRDAILDRTPLLQKVVGDSSPREIIKQLAVIDSTEADFRANRRSAG